jgi:hypothetical protein
VAKCAYQQRDSGRSLKIDPLLKSLHKDPAIPVSKDAPPNLMERFAIPADEPYYGQLRRRHLLGKQKD